MTPYPKTKRRPSKNETGEFSRGTATLAVVRDLGLCAWCAALLVGDRGPMSWQWQVHHRWPRAAGGTSEAFVARVSNAVPLHGTCHLVIEENRTDAEKLGFIIRHGIRRPPAVPIQHKVHGLVRLTDEGSWERVAA